MRLFGLIALQHRHDKVPGNRMALSSVWVGSKNT
jgi:hypothetical protein